MDLPETDCWARLEQARHGVLATVHERRGVDAVPVVFAVAGHLVAVPVDSVKPKRTMRLQRLANLAADPRCVLLVDGYSEDWSELWWVRLHALAGPPEPPGRWLDLLAARYPQYRLPGAVESVVLLRPTWLTGWAARAG